MRKTVFIVGAGASTDFGLPVGSGLADWIRVRLTGELSGLGGILIDAAMMSGKAGNFRAAAEDLAGGLLAARSIDRLIHSRRDRELFGHVGKVSIAAAISEHEQLSPLGSRIGHEDDWAARQAGLESARGSWLARLFSLLQEGVQPNHSQAVMDSVSFVTFNYDRCIERYLQLAFRQIMDQAAERASELVLQVPIVHVYGRLGPLPGLEGSSETVVPFGVNNGEYLDHMASNLRTFTEAIDDGVITDIRNLIDQAEVVVFLGFAFDPLNVDALFARGPLRPDQRVIGTAFDLSPATLYNFQLKAFGAHPNIPDKALGREDFLPSRCNDFVNELMFRSALQIE
jgi:hypothetical protein